MTVNKRKTLFIEDVIGDFFLVTEDDDLGFDL